VTGARQVAKKRKKKKTSQRGDTRARYVYRTRHPTKALRRARSDRSGASACLVLGQEDTSASLAAQATVRTGPKRARRIAPWIDGPCQSQRGDHPCERGGGGAASFQRRGGAEALEVVDKPTLSLRQPLGRRRPASWRGPCRGRESDAWPVMPGHDVSTTQYEGWRTGHERNARTERRKRASAPAMSRSITHGRTGNRDAPPRNERKQDGIARYIGVCHCGCEQPDEPEHRAQHTCSPTTARRSWAVPRSAQTQRGPVAEPDPEQGRAVSGFRARVVALVLRSRIQSAKLFSLDASAERRHPRRGEVAAPLCNPALLAAETCRRAVSGGPAYGDKTPFVASPESLWP